MRRPCFLAALAMLSSRAKLEANAVTAMRPFKVPINASRLSRTLPSEPVWPETSALVESQTSASTPSSPSFSMAALSVTSPSTGSGSSFQSPVWAIRPRGVLMASRFGSRIEWVMETNSMLNGPSFMVPPTGTSRTRRLDDSPASSSLPSISRAVKGVA